MNKASKLNGYLSRSMKYAITKLEEELLPDLKDKNDYVSIKNQFETATKFLKSGRISQESYDKRCERMKHGLKELIDRTYDSKFKKLNKNKRTEKEVLLKKRDIVDGRNKDFSVIRKSSAKFNKLSSRKKEIDL